MTMSYSKKAMSPALCFCSKSVQSPCSVQDLICNQRNKSAWLFDREEGNRQLPWLLDDLFVYVSLSQKIMAALIR